MNNILKVRNVSKKYNTIKEEIEAIKDVSFDINEGEFVSIVGPSGCGKSTLLSIIAGLVPLSDGVIKYKNDRTVIGYMLQEDALFEHYSVLDNILLGLKVQHKLDDYSKENAIRLLDKYNLKEFSDKRPSELSGGMKQRVG